MAILGSQRRKLRDFLQQSFNRDQMDCFLEDYDYEQARRNVSRDGSEEQYFVDLVRELARQGAIDASFFEKLITERQIRKSEILDLKELLLGSDADQADS
jgi:hypothetical protein